MGGGYGNLVLMQLFVTGVCTDFSVEYQQKHICAVKGSSVVIFCLFNYPGMFNQQKAKTVMWGHEKYNIYDGPFIYDSTLRNNSKKFQYIGDKHRNCSLKIHQVEHNDIGKYAFRFIIDDNKSKFTGPEGSTLTVVDLRILLSKAAGIEMKEGESVKLTCTNGCDDGNNSPTIRWFKDGKNINEGPVLHLNNMTSNSSGNYTCSLKNHPETLSEVTNIDVEYGPKDTSVSVRPSTEVDVGSNITLSCSSDANPRVMDYSWFAITDDAIKEMGHEPKLHLTEFVAYGRYLCSATNKHGSQNSSVVILKTKGIKPAVYRYAFVIAAVSVFLIVVTGIIIIRFSTKKIRTPKNGSQENAQDTRVYVNWPVFDNNQLQDGKKRDEGPEVVYVDNNQLQDGKKCDEGPEVVYATVHITTRRTNTEQQVDSHADVIYSTVCWSQNSNPQQH